MSGSQRIGGIASLVNAAVSIANVLIVILMVGAANTDVNAMATMAQNNPTPLTLLEVLKLVSAAAAAVVAFAVFQRLGGRSSRASLIGLLPAVVADLLFAL